MTGNKLSVTYSELREAFDGLQAPAGQRSLAYGSLTISGSSLRLGKAQDGSPALIVPVMDAVTPNGTSRHLAHLRVRHGLKMRLATDDTPSHFSVVECVARDASLRDWFLRLAPYLIGALTPDATVAGINKYVDGLSELLKNVDAGSTRSVSGLWGELALLLSSPRPEVLARAWHSSPMSTHDFTWSGAHIEVKTTERDVRVHNFSAGQLDPQEAVLVASWVLKPADAGVNVLDLYERVLNRLHPWIELQQKLHEQVLHVVGRRIASAEDLRYDMPAAARSLRLYRADMLPRLQPPFPPGVSNVRFATDLTGVPNIELKNLQKWDLWSCISMVADETAE